MICKDYMNLLLPYLTMNALAFKEDLLNCLQYAITPEKIKSLNSKELKKAVDVLNKVYSTEKKPRTKVVADQLLKRINDIVNNSPPRPIRTSSK